jgi:hypothetical protein
MFFEGFLFQIFGAYFEGFLKVLLELFKGLQGWGL